MVRRLVLGSGALGHDVIERAVEWSGSLLVVTDDRSRVTALRDESIRATEADPADSDAYPEGADVVIVASDDPERNRAVAETAREFYGDALLVVYTGESADEGTKAAVTDVADRVIDPEVELARRFLDAAVGASANRLHRLRRTLRDIDGTLAVVTHDNPDPDAIASAIAMVRIARAVGLEADACYYGEISHQENRALVNLLDIELTNLRRGESLEGYGGVALVDHSRPGVNDGLPVDTDVDIVVDHHPPRKPVEARFIDLRDDVGATSTLLAEYFEELDVEPDRQVATALLYGIRIDTKDFTREVSGTDFEAAAFLLSTADESVLERVEAPSVSSDTLETVARAIRNREVRETVLATCVGEIRDRDALAQAADRLLDMEGITVTLVYGFTDGTIYASGRARGADLDLGETMRDAFEAIGSAGGHADMAGAQIPLGILADVEGDSRESLAEIVDDIVSERFFETLSDAPPAPRRRSAAELAFEYPTADRRSGTDRNDTDRSADDGEDAIDREARNDSGSEGGDDGGTPENGGADGSSTAEPGPGF